MPEARELLAMSKRPFRRDRDRFEEDGDTGMIDRRLGRRSPQRVPGRQLRLMPDLYRDCSPAGQHVRIASTTTRPAVWCNAQGLIAPYALN
jgi:hypothetical protein